MPEWVKRCAKIIGIGAAVLAFMAQVGPGDAVSNIAKWLKYFGIEQMPHWLYSAGVDKYILGLSITIFFMCLIIIFYPLKRKTEAVHSAKVNKRAEALEKEALEKFQENLKERARISRQTMGIPEPPERDKTKK